MDIIKTKKSGKQCHKQPVALAKPLIKETDNQEVYSLEFDGASKGNPGKAGAGAILKRPDGTVLCRLTKGVGMATNNFAEYQALILGLQAALAQGVCHIKAQGDSKLVCSQVMGKWQVRSENLSASFAEAMELKKRFQSFSIQHVYRECNSAADALANAALLLPADTPFTSCNSSSEQQMTPTSSKSKSIAQNHKGSEDGSVAIKECRGIDFSEISQEERRRFYRMDYHGAFNAKGRKAAIGALLYTPDGSLCLEIKQGLGATTHNVAHYQALVTGLRVALECNVSHIVIQGDGLLVFKQMTGQVKVKDDTLVSLWKEAHGLLNRFSAFSITVVDKCKNSAACALAERAVCSLGRSDYNALDGRVLETKDSHGCVDVTFQDSSSRSSIGKEIRRSVNPLSKARANLLLTDCMDQAHRSQQCCWSSASHHQVSQALRTKATQPLTCAEAVSKCLPLHGANASIPKVATFLFPSKRFRCIPHIFQSSLVHITGSMRVSTFISTLSIG